MAQSVEIREGYIAVVFSGVVTPATVGDALGESSDVRTAMRRTPRVLFEFSQIESFGFDPLTLGDGMQRLAALGVRLAVSSSNPEFFGVGRQIALYSGVEAVAIAVFDNEAEAVGWLLDKKD